MFKSDVNAHQLIANMTDIEKTQFPFALAKALNDTAFQDVQRGWKDEISLVFDNPVRLTLGAVRVKRARKNQKPAPAAEIYLRDTASRGTPPARYLEHHVEPGTRPKKPFENILIRSGIMSADEFAVPGKSFPLDAYGNVPGRVVQTVLKDLQASRGEDTSGFSTRKSRARRERRRKRRGGIYFLSRGERRQLPRGIYERILTGFGSSVRSVFVFVKSARYNQRFDAYGLASKLFNDNFPKRFKDAMAQAMRTRRK